MNNTRYARVYQFNAGWLKVPFYHLKAGDTFMMYEEDDTLVTDENGDSVFRAMSDAFFHDGVWKLRQVAERYVDEDL